MGKNSMNIRNPKRISETFIDCEIEHPELGWIPFTACSEQDESAKNIYDQIVNDEAGEITDGRPSQEEILTEIKQTAYHNIDIAATNARHRYISPDKHSTYQLKREELEKWISDGRPEECEEGCYPYMERESYYCEMPLKDTAELIEYSANAWKQLDPEIEGVCRGGKVKVLAAITAEDAENIANATITTLNNI